MMNLTRSAQYAGALTLALLAVPLPAQTVRQVGQAPVGQANAQLAFGYECEDRFALRNEGATSLVVEYAVAGTPERGTVNIQAGETVQLESVTPNDLQLFVDGRLVATEAKGNRACADVLGGGDRVIVRHYVARDIVYVGGVYVRPWNYGYYPGPVIRVSFGLGRVFGDRRGGFIGDERAPVRRGGWDREDVRDRGTYGRNAEPRRGDDRRAEVTQRAAPRAQHGWERSPRAEPTRQDVGRQAPNRSGSSRPDRGRESGKGSGKRSGRDSGR